MHDPDISPEITFVYNELFKIRRNVIEGYTKNLKATCETSDGNLIVSKMKIVQKPIDCSGYLTPKPNNEKIIEVEYEHSGVKHDLMFDVFFQKNLSIQECSSTETCKLYEATAIDHCSDTILDDDEIIQNSEVDPVSLSASRQVKAGYSSFICMRCTHIVGVTKESTVKLTQKNLDCSAYLTPISNGAVYLE